MSHTTTQREWSTRCDNCLDSSNDDVSYDGTSNGGGGENGNAGGSVDPNDHRSGDTADLIDLTTLRCLTTRLLGDEAMQQAVVSAVGLRLGTVRSLPNQWLKKLIWGWELAAWMVSAWVTRGRVARQARWWWVRME